MEANLIVDKLKYYPFKGYFLFVLSKSRQMANDIITDVKTEPTADFRILKEPQKYLDLSEVIQQDLGEIEKRFKILAIYSSPNKQNLSYIKH